MSTTNNDINNIKVNKLSLKDVLNYSPKYYYGLTNASSSRELKECSDIVYTKFGSLTLQFRDLNTIYDYGLTRWDSFLIDASEINENNIQLLNIIACKASELNFNLIIFYKEIATKEKLINLAKENNAVRLLAIQLEEIKSINKDLLSEWINNILVRSSRLSFRFFDRVVFTLLQVIIVTAFYAFPLFVLAGVFFQFNGEKYNFLIIAALLTSGNTAFKIFLGYELSIPAALSLYGLIELLFYYQEHIHFINSICYFSLSLITYISYHHLRTFFDNIEFSNYIFSELEDYGKKEDDLEHINVFEPGFIWKRYLNQNVYRPENPILCMQAFISHRNNTLGKELSVSIKDELDTLGIKSYIDFLDIQGGFEFRDELSRGFRNSNILICILTEMSSVEEKEWLQRELKASSVRSLHSGLPIIIVIEASETLKSLLRDDPIYSDKSSPISKARDKIITLTLSNKNKLKIEVREAIVNSLHTLTAQKKDLKSSRNILKVCLSLTPYCLILSWSSFFYSQGQYGYNFILFLSTLVMLTGFGGVSLVKILHKILSKSSISLKNYSNKISFHDSISNGTLFLILITIAFECFGQHMPYILSASVLGVSINFLYGELYESYNYSGLLTIDSFDDTN